MKKSYVKPVLNASMEGTLEGVYAYGQAACHCWIPCNHQPEKKSSNNGEVPASHLMPARPRGHWQMVITCHFPYVEFIWVVD